MSPRRLSRTDRRSSSSCSADPLHPADHGGARATRIMGDISFESQPAPSPPDGERDRVPERPQRGSKNLWIAKRPDGSEPTGGGTRGRGRPATRPQLMVLRRAGTPGTGQYPSSYRSPGRRKRTARRLPDPPGTAGTGVRLGDKAAPKPTPGASPGAQPARTGSAAGCLGGWAAHGPIFAERARGTFNYNAQFPHLAGGSASTAKTGEERRPSPAPPGKRDAPPCCTPDGPPPWCTPPDTAPGPRSGCAISKPARSAG